MRTWIPLLFIGSVFSIIDIDVVRIIDNFENWKQLRQSHLDVYEDYPLGWPAFSCPLPSLPDPEDVHHVAPQHLTVVAAMGDSLTAARTAKATSFKDIATEYRGISFSMGGDGDVATVGTIPNILRRFSPSLVGASHGISLSSDEFLSQLNVAQSGATSDEMLAQAEELVRRMSNHSSVSLADDWKLVTVFIGSNDLCRRCGNTTEMIANYRRSVFEAVAYLRDHLPRTIVNVLPAFHVNVLLDTEPGNRMCPAFHRQFCPCVQSLPREEFNRVKKDMDDSLLGLYGKEFQTDSFAVNLIPALNITAIPKFKVSKLVWRNLFQPVGERTGFEEFTEKDAGRYDCPPDSFPYFRTLGNSNATVVSEALRALPTRLTHLPLRPVTPKGRRVRTITLPSVSELEKEAQAQSAQSQADQPAQAQASDSSNLSWILPVAAFALLAAVLFVGTRQRKARMNERTPLLTADMYDQDSLF